MASLTSAQVNGLPYFELPHSQSYWEVAFRATKEWTYLQGKYGLGLGRGGGGGQVVSMLAFYSDDQSSNPA